jgi:hypothetical protein
MSLTEKTMVRNIILYKRVFNERYFDCAKKFGLFLRPDKIEVGNFPELDLDDEL